MTSILGTAWNGAAVVRAEIDRRMSGLEGRIAAAEREQADFQPAVAARQEAREAARVENVRTGAMLFGIGGAVLGAIGGLLAKYGLGTTLGHAAWAAGGGGVIGALAGATGGEMSNHLPTKYDDDFERYLDASSRLDELESDRQDLERAAHRSDELGAAVDRLARFDHDADGRVDIRGTLPLTRDERFAYAGPGGGPLRSARDAREAVNTARDLDGDQWIDQSEVAEALVDRFAD